MNVRTLNIATVAVAVLLFTAFVVLAEGIGGDDDDDNRLATIATTTTEVTLPRMTTTSPPATFPVPSTVVTVAPFVTPTTRPTVTTRRSTATTARRTATTRRPTATTAAPAPPAGPNGRATETSDNTASFTHNADGTTSESATPVSSNPGALVFKVTTKVVSASGTTAQVRFTVDVTNQRGRRITFPDGLRVTLNVSPSNGTPFAIVMDAREVTFIEQGETVTAATTAPVEGHGTFTVQGSVEVDYGQ